MPRTRTRIPHAAAPPPPLSRGALAGRVTLVVLALGLLVAAAVFEGVRSNRWGVPEDLQAAAARLDRVPPAFGDWVSAEVPVDAKILERAEAVGSVSRVYRNNKTGVVVSVMLLCGPAGPIAAHTPDVCYAGLGYAMDGGEIKKTIPAPAGPATYWSARFAQDKKDPGIDVNWAWGADDTWAAAARPRMEFAAHSVLYKIYATRQLPPAPPARPGQPEPDPVHDFLTEFLPVLRTALDPG